MVKEVCSRCHEVPQDILVLQCEHRVCLDCASEIFDCLRSLIGCKKCGEQTQLDPQIADQLILHGKRLRRMHKQASRKLHKKSRIKESRTKYTSKQNQRCDVNQSKNQQNKSKIKASKYEQKKKMPKILCRFHEDYEIMYICNQCNSSYVCPQCIIHGSHKGHNVISFKGFLLESQNYLQQQIDVLQNSAKQLCGLAEQRKREIDDRIADINRLKNLALEKYSLIKLEISKQENDLIEELQILLDCYKKDLQNLDSVLYEDIEFLNQKKEQICQILSPLHGISQLASKEIEIQVITNCLKYKMYHRNFQSKANQLFFGKSRNRENEDKEEQIQELTDRIQNIGVDQFTDKKCKQVQDKRPLINSLINHIYTEGPSNRKTTQESEKRQMKKNVKFKSESRSSFYDGYEENRQDFLIF